MKFADRRSGHHLRKEFFFRNTRVPYAIDRFTDCRTVLDLGANVGLFSMCALFHIQQVRVVAVEPDPATFELLTDNLDGLPAECHQIALGKDAETCYITPATSRKNSLTRHYEGDANNEVGMFSIPSLSLVSMFDRFAIDPATCFVKMDTEGAEHEVFNSDTDKAILKSCLGFAVEFHLRLRTLPPIIEEFQQTHETIYDDIYRWKSRNLCMRRR